MAHEPDLSRITHKISGCLSSNVGTRELLCPRTLTAEDGDKVVHGLALILHNAFRDPNKIADFLFLQLDIRIEAP